MSLTFAGDVAVRYDAAVAHIPVEPVVDFLQPLAHGGALEFAIGTGRIAKRSGPPGAGRLFSDRGRPPAEHSPERLRAERWIRRNRLDLMARLAGLELRERWADWERSPFTAASAAHVSVWEKPAG